LHKPKKNLEKDMEEFLYTEKIFYRFSLPNDQTEVKLRYSACEGFQT